MFIVISLLIIIVTYISLFKEEFTQETLDKLNPVLGVLVVLLIGSILLALLGLGAK